MSTRVYIGRLSYEVRERHIETFFKGYGKIREILIKNGFGFVEFDDYKDADDAVYELNGKELLGERVILELARGPVRRGGGGGGSGGGGGRYGPRRRGSWIDKYGPPTRTEYRLIVENLSSRVSWQDLKDFMRQAGEVTYADAHKQRRNEGVVEFASYSDMKSAMKKLDGSELNGRRIRLVVDRPHRSRSRSRSSSRSRSRSRRSATKSRSRSPRSRSRSRSKTPEARMKENRSRSRSKSRSRSRGREESRSRSRSRTPAPADDDRRDSSPHYEEKSEPDD